MSSYAAARLTSVPFLKTQSAYSEERTNANDNLPDLPDEVLLDRISNHHREALGTLFRRHARLIHGIGRRILRDNAEAEDLVQDVFLHIARKSSLFDSSKGSARSWIIQLTYFQALNRRGYLNERHYYTALNCEEADTEELATPVIAEYDHSGEALFGRKRWQRVCEMLTEDQWETIRLHFFEGFTLAEIAERRNQPKGNVRNHFYRGLARLRKHLFEPPNRLPEVSPIASESNEGYRLRVRLQQ